VTDAHIYPLHLMIFIDLRIICNIFRMPIFRKLIWSLTAVCVRSDRCNEQ